MTYYNTNNVSGDRLLQARACSKKQDDRILAFFRDYPGNWSPEEVWEAVERKTCPLTSVRRAISTLTDDGFLQKTNTMKPGMYGKPIHTWVFRGKNEQVTLF